MRWQSKNVQEGLVPNNSLQYLLDRHFVWSLNPWEDWDELLTLGPGICLLFLALPLQREYTLTAARETDGEVANLASAWVREEPLVDLQARRYVRFGAFPDAEERSQTFQFVLTKLTTVAGS